MRRTGVVVVALGALGCSTTLGAPRRDAGPMDAVTSLDTRAAADAHAVPVDATHDVASALEPDAPLPPCEPLGGEASLRVEPVLPWVGGSMRVLATAAPDYTNVGVRVVAGTPQPEARWIGVSGTPHVWSWSMGPLAAGTSCLELYADPAMTPYARTLVTVSSEPPMGGAAFKVTQNHQWTCEEEYEWAINVDVRVEDEAGAPLPGAHVALEHEPCDLRGAAEPPAELVTGEDGTVRWENYYPRCFFHLRVTDGPSDTAIEIYTGIWETQRDASGADCNYCNEFAQNVWGHWSYSVTFRRTTGATEICDVPTDHAGQSRCAPLMHWEEPRGPCTAL
ncbi:MAG: hypothetical protein K1X94_08650 [Sandaracinaceae bacterium]|nr:hypothetical protein [Sandaracinaceae bacterium]